MSHMDNIVTISINSCTDCPHCLNQDGGQGTYNLTCREKAKVIAIHHEDRHYCAIPDWCPLLKKRVRRKQ